MPQHSTIVFVCEHGAAKSVIAAAYFNKLAAEMGLDIKAVARGTQPDSELSPKTVQGLLEDGLNPMEFAPQMLLLDELKSAQKIVTFCELPEEYEQGIEFEQWDGVPAVSKNYRTARNIIVENINRLLTEIDK